MAKEHQRAIGLVLGLGAVIVLHQEASDLIQHGFHSVFLRSTYQVGQTYEVGATQVIGADGTYKGSIDTVRRGDGCTLEENGSATVSEIGPGSQRRFVYKRPSRSTRRDACPSGQQFSAGTFDADKFLGNPLIKLN